LPWESIGACEIAADQDLTELIEGDRMEPICPAGVGCPTTTDIRSEALVDGSVNEMAEQPDGKIVIVGELITTQEGVHGRVARLHPGGHLDFILPLTAGPDATVNALALDKDSIWIAGAFTHVNGFTRHGIARLRGDSSPSLEILSPGFEGATFGVSAQTINGRRCFLEYKNAISDTAWIALPSVSGDGRLTRFSDPTPPGAQRFYRLRAE
jgi:hypothetical protein